MSDTNSSIGGSFFGFFKPVISVTPCVNCPAYPHNPRNRQRQSWKVLVGENREGREGKLFLAF